ncbi:MAG: isoleucine--tRNA ligase [Planctomycetaceae bacterium]|nr:isoleucine--tRNA ligase [Planctomycetaceae bacterium]
MFQPAESNVSFPELEERIVQFWKDRRIYEKSLEMRAGAPAFVFYEGPPTANGLPHPGHCLTRSIKDLFPRYKTMRGFRCERKAGWDTHGLPVEVEVCKELGIHSKEEIEAYGVEPFIHKCLESVFRYTREWEDLTERLGFWIHLDDAYVTYHQSYVESVWWSLKNLFDRGLLYQGHKIVWWWAQGGTALSSGEVGEGYREVADPSVYVRFPLLDDSGTDLLVWTTTPWTLPSNQFAAVHPELEYSVVAFEGEERNLVIASALVETIAAKVGKEFNVRGTLQGSELIGRRYRPPFDYYHKTLGEVEGTLKGGGTEPIAWRVVAADFVTIDSGTGVVHQAPAFGEVDYEVLLAEQARFVDGEGPELICSVGPDGKFTGETPDYEGRWVKEADRDLSRRLREEGTLFHQEQYLHDYPFCWRAEDDPLIQYPRKSWFIRTTQFKDRMLANNRRINWLPEHIRDGRFGNFLETNVDWALSRERYWGTPLPIWVCEETGYMEAVANYDELLAKPGVEGTDVWEKAKQANPDLSDDLKIHKPYIDAVTYESPKAPGKRMRRVPEVIDCWYDSGSMPFAQWGYPHKKGSRERFAAQFPADFISEAIDQTRGWFYSQLAISTLLFSEDNGRSNDTRTVAYPHPFANCIVLGLMLAEWWESQDGKQRFLSEAEARQSLGKGNYTHKIGKMSKSLRNYRSPDEIFNTYGADALRWYFFANQAPWTSIIYSEQAIKECIPGFLLRLWNVFGFFTIYANIDQFDPAAEIAGDAAQITPDVLGRAKTYRPVEKRGELDQWILSELNRTIDGVTEAMDAYDNFAACGRLNQFVDALSNWYVRRSRDRFWGSGTSDDKIDGYWTLYECLVTTTKLIAPFVPFLAERMWQNLAVTPFGDRVAESVHLCDYPTGDAAIVNGALSGQMALVREVVSLGRSARMGAKLKVRQPLAQVEIVLADQTHRGWLESHAALIREELNVKNVEFITKADQYISYTILPDLKRLGPKLGKQVPAVRKHLAGADGAALLAELEASGKVALQLEDGKVELDSDDIQVRLQAKEGWAAAQGKACVVVLATELTVELVTEGLAREIVHAVQNRRKDMNCEYTDRIAVAIVTESAELQEAIEKHGDYIAGETLIATGRLGITAFPDAEPVELKLAGFAVTLYVKVVTGSGKA